jgi:hypothetical protein
MLAVRFVQLVSRLGAIAPVCPTFKLWMGKLKLNLYNVQPPALTSRCMTPRAWQCSSALNSCIMRCLICPSRNPPAAVFCVADNNPARSCSPA